MSEKMIITVEGGKRKIYEEFYHQMCIELEDFGLTFDKKIVRDEE